MAEEKKEKKVVAVGSISPQSGIEIKSTNEIKKK